MSSPAAESVAQLASLFPDLPVEALTGVLGACEGDVSRAADIITQLMSRSTRSDEPKWSPLDDDGPVRSTAELCGSHTSTCGYCKGKRKSTKSYGMVCKTLTVQDYQALIDLGWRRSGDYCYKQDNTASCCPHYTIRLNVHKFTRSKAQRHAMNRFERFLQGHNITGANGGDAEGATEPAVAAAAAAEMDTSEAPVAAAAKKVDADPHADGIRSKIVSAIESLVSQGVLPAILTPAIYEKALRVYPFVEPTKAGKKASTASSESAATTSSTEAVAAAPPSWNYTTNVALILSGALKKQKVESQQSAVLIAKSIAQLCDFQTGVAEPQGYLNCYLPGVALPRPRSASNAQQQQKSKKAPFARQPVEESAPTAASSSATSSAPAAALTPHTFEIRQVPAEFDEAAFEVYRKYQMSVHKDKESKLTADQYTNFLCNSPLVPEGPYGGFHHHYLLDGKLIAVGVVDILPSCLSSVYLFYDPAYEFLNLGTVTAMKEIDWIQTRLTPSYPALKYYYLGLFIWSCPKMKYKAAFRPSDLLCPVRATWHPLEACRTALDFVRDANPPLSPLKGPRCVILSDISDETREEDGSPPIYLSPSVVQRLTKSGEAEEENKRKRKKSTDSDAPDSDENESMDAAAAASSPPVTAASSSAAAAASAATASTAPSSSAASSSSAYPPIDATHPYVFSTASLKSSADHRHAVVESVTADISVSIHEREPVPFSSIHPRIQNQIVDPVEEYVALVGAELAMRMVATF